LLRIAFYGIGDWEFWNLDCFLFFGLIVSYFSSYFIEVSKKIFYCSHWDWLSMKYVNNVDNCCSLVAQFCAIVAHFLSEL